MPSKVIIIDYGSQVTQLIARRVREAGVYSEIHPCVVTAAQVKAMQPSAIILSGGPASVGEKDAPALDKGFLDLGVPVLGICYGMQLLAFNLGGGLEQSETREYGPADLRFVRSCALWDGLDSSKASRVWMSHGDKVKTPPPGFVITGSTPTLEVATMADESRKIYAVQFHPEVHHSVDGDAMLRNFLFKVCNIVPDWSMSSFVERVVKEMAEKIGDKHVVCALSGGIDSPVASWMIAKRGIALEMVHFFSYPYTSEEAKQKVLTLAKLLTPWCGRLTVHVVPFTAIQEELRRKCPEELFTVLMRRFMMRIAEAVAQRCGAGAIVTGECLGQVASQTMEAMRATTAVTTLPILRPVVGMDKEEIVRIARKINTFETSILPYEDCCTVFTPRHPRLRPVLGELEAAEAALDVEGLVKAAVDGIERVQV